MAVHRDAAAHRHPPGRRLTATPDDVERELRRVAERIVSLGPARLARPSGADPDGPAVQDRVHEAAQRFADVAADVERRPVRPVPRLAPHGLADQVVVLARDVLLAAHDDAVTPADRDAVTARLHADLVTLRRAL